MSNIQDVQRSLQVSGLPLRKHRELQIAVIETFVPYFTPESTVLYMGDAANKFVIYEQEKLAELGVPITMHDRLPDIILYDEVRNWLYLIEAVTSHGTIGPDCLFELERLLKNCTPKRIYISAFFDFAEYGRYMLPFAWDTVPRSNTWPYH